MLAPSLLLLASLGAPAHAAVCPDIDLETSGIGPRIATGDTRGLGADWLPTCGSPDPAGGDFAMEFTAPFDGTFVFDTYQSDFDTTLTLFSTGDCQTALGCDDDSGLSVLSRIEHDMVAGEKVVVVVDGFQGAEGRFELSVLALEPPVCAEDEDLGSALGDALASGNTCGAGNDYDHATCGNGQASEDVAFRWQAPATDLFTIDTNGSRYDTAITLRNGACSEQYCDDDGGLGNASQVTISATAGEVLYVVVDGFGQARCGDYVLNINQGCPDRDDDTICDPDDICTGDDRTGDSDNDGKCDDIDLCFGYDPSGDSDADGTCDDIDFIQDTPRPYDDSFMPWMVHNAAPNSRVYFAASIRGTGVGDCLPNGVCLDILNAVVAAEATADASGNASVLVRVPGGTAGRTCYFQSVWSDGNGGEKTEVDSAVVNP